MKRSHRKFDILFSQLCRLFWMATLCLSLYVLNYAMAMGGIPLDVRKTDAAVYQMTEVVILCAAMILLANIVWELVKKSAKER